ncbi:COX15/CtaA family protein [Novosphingobium sp.]|uniref:COX15/CtaA family protein n=1 Tax=Novosphingobium sp. TaxID=1874826 RepID=UPI0022C1D591|nr:COX15/CtaA family protein [Novosphingobium sp.]MCZ8018981.1 COX15/CtaA family protein [Novosphingobium sp.]MCZ8034587.1 COX15/CtaA family protein [Novosphingobium sp.]MCZ8052135.1 COX15/CtaA family protein [Novosphingobium sp.]MCZ8060061.1 COX15/CtaA family protein [Novosphingobium sp.]MCZ8231023.1 COX15/CtaA family protein [Novosphingobium sp.]
MTAPSPRPLALARWLFAVAALVVFIVAVGGITRLTESGLSITEWKPVSGILPPLNEAQWEKAFDDYKQIPQYIEVTGPAGMTLADFKFIFFWEWVHRVIARIIGLAFAIPLAWFWIKGAIPKGYHGRLVALLALGGLQGTIGWWMVSSGLSNDIRVSHFRLATHLLVALFTLAGLIWTALDLRALARGEPRARLTGFTVFVSLALLVQLFFGALVAGMRAGYVAGAGWFNWDVWPLMQGSFFPAGIDWAMGQVHALLNDPFLTHFVHRWWAWGVVAILVVMARKLRPIDRRASIAIHATFGTQVLLGIATVYSGVELWIAVAHQLVGALLVASVAWGAHALGRRPA